jgi:hypothetical protein
MGTAAAELLLQVALTIQEPHRRRKQLGPGQHPIVQHPVFKTLKSSDIASFVDPMYAWLAVDHDQYYWQSEVRKLLDEFDRTMLAKYHRERGVSFLPTNSL